MGAKRYRAYVERDGLSGCVMEWSKMQFPSHVERCLHIHNGQMRAQATSPRVSSRLGQVSRGRAKATAASPSLHGEVEGTIVRAFQRQEAHLCTYRISFHVSPLGFPLFRLEVLLSFLARSGQACGDF
jgi:hypothetical protein